VASAADDITDLQDKIRSGISRLKGLDIGDETAIEILANLIGGRKTVAEIVERIYGLGSKDEGYFSAYTRVNRVIRRLESKGLVSRRVFGRDKPYRLTDLAIINLARIGGGAKQVSALPMRDIATYLATVAASLPLAVIAFQWAQFSEPVIIAMFGLFCFLFGVSFTRVLEGIRRVF
jgi:hypothetical protein